MTKVLYFEGAGWEEADSSKTTIGNCRVRTAFTNDEGQKIYLELSVGCIYNKKEVERYFINVDHVFYITGDKDDCNINQINFDWKETRENYDYTVEDITKWINKNLNCSFDTIKVLTDLAGYRVHKGNKEYNLADDFIYDEALTEKRKEIKQYFYDLEKSEGKKYPNFSLWVDEEDKNILHLLRHFNGYNKHWTIRTDAENWLDTVTETKLGKYAC